MSGEGAIAVLDVGKTNIKLAVCTAAGAVVETLSCPNRSRPGPPWRHHDLTAQEVWVFAALADLGSRHDLTDFIASGHGVGAVLVGDDPDAPPVLPMIDYEQDVPEGLTARYAALVSDFNDRGSAILHGATHIARQMLWAEETAPRAFAQASHVLGLPQYWAWKLSGQARREISHLAAQSHLWNLPEDRPTRIVRDRGWAGMLPERAPAWADLGPIRPELAARHGVPTGLRIHTGVHDSSANLYRYQAAGLSDFVLVSTGTWIVAMADGIAGAAINPDKGMTLNADVVGRPVGGALCMGGREFAVVAGAQPETAMADLAAIDRLIARGTMAIPAFVDNDGQFPGRAGRGRIIGPTPESAAEKLALAVLYTALLTTRCADVLSPGRPMVLDGGFLRDPAFAETVAALRPEATTRIQKAGDGVAAGCAMLCRHEDRPKTVIALEKPENVSFDNDISRYARMWHEECMAIN